MQEKYQKFPTVSKTIQSYIFAHPIIIYSIVAIVLCVASYLLGFYRGTHVSHQPERAGNIERQLDEAESQQRTITERIAKSQESAGDLQERIERSQTSVKRAEASAERITGALTESADLIAECQQIIERVQRRPAPDTAQD